MDDDELPGGDDPPVGYCNPPYEYQWAPGYCPNRKGRPKRKKAMDDSVPLNPFQKRIFDHANKVVAEIDGKPITNLDKALLKLSTSDNPADRKLLLSAYEDAIAADRKWREEAVAKLQEYKDYWGPIFEKRRAAGRPLPNQIPDPEDIRLLSSTEFRFLGPVTKEEAHNWKLFMQWRKACITIANEIIESAGLFRPVEEARAFYDRIRRQFYRVNRQLPDAFKKKHPVRFPAFKPPAQPPEWYGEDDEWKDENGEWVRAMPAAGAA